MAELPSLVVIESDDMAAAVATGLPTYTLETAIECRSSNIVIVARADGAAHIERMQIGSAL